MKQQHSTAELNEGKTIERSFMSILPKMTVTVAHPRTVGKVVDSCKSHCQFCLPHCRRLGSRRV